MPGRQDNVLRTYRVLVVRSHDGFLWQIRYGRNTGVVQQSAQSYKTSSAAETVGEEALAAIAKTTVLLGNSVIEHRSR